MTRKHQKGDSIRLNAELQNKVEELALASTLGFASVGGLDPFMGFAIRVKNVSGDHMARRELCLLGAYVVDPHDAKQGGSDPTIAVGAPTWPEVFGTFGLLLEPVPDTKFGKALIMGIGQATVNVISTDHRFAAPDHEEPTRLRSSDTGEVRLRGEPAATGVRTMLVEMVSRPSVIWHYERTEDYPGDAVKVLGLDDTAFSGTSTVDMIDTRELMDDQVNGEKGIMHQVGNQFIAGNAAC